MFIWTTYFSGKELRTFRSKSSPSACGIKGRAACPASAWSSARVSLLPPAMNCSDECVWGKSGLTRVSAWKRGECFNSLFRQFWVFLVLYWNANKSSFLNLSHRVESETESRELRHFVALKSSICPVSSGLSTVRGFLTTGLRSWRAWADRVTPIFRMSVCVSIHSIKKSPFSIIPLVTLENWILGSCQALGSGYLFQNSDFNWMAKFCHWQEILGFFPFEVTGSLFIFAPWSS